jgi:Flp pilus assembly protein TadD
MAAVAVRIALALTALAVTIALALQLRAHDLLANAAETAAQPKPSQALVDKRLSDLNKVNDLRPGSQAALAAATLDLRTSRIPAAIGDAARATHREPKNFSAWVTLAVARGNAGDKRGRDAAFAKAHELNPRYPIPR